MSDIKKGYTFTDKSTDWASNKETAIRLNKMMDEAKLNLVAGTNVTITSTINGPQIDVAGAGTGSVTSIDVDGGTGISVSPAGPITTAGTFTVTNTAPDQVVALTGGTGITTSGTYPNFTVTNSAPDQTVAISGGTGITTSGTYPSFTVTNSAPDQTVALTQGGTTTITGTYPNFSISSADQYTGTVTSVSGAGGSTGLTLSGGPITGSGTLTLGGTLAVANGGTGTASPSLVAGTNVTISGSWPNQTVNSTAGGGGGGTVTSVSVVSGNGLAGTVANATTTPAITLSTTVNGLVKGNGTTLSAATAGSDYQAPITLTTTGTSGAATFVSNTLNIPQYAGGGGSGTVTSVSVVTANGVSGSVANPTTTPAITLTLGDISAASSKPSGGTARSFTSRNGDVFNVRDYGALGDGSTDDSTAFQSAVDAAVASSTGGCVYIPAGRYVLNSRIVKTGIALPKSLSIVGDGQGVSVLSAYSASGVFQIGFASATEGSQNSLLMADFSVAVETTSATAATGFDLSWASSGSNTFQSLEIRGVTFNPQSAYYGTAYYKRFIKLTNVWNAKIHDCLVRGPNTIPSGLDSCVGIELATNSGSESNPVHITDCDFYGVTIGVYITGNLESTIMDQCMFLGDYGVYCIPATAQEHLSISNCHASNKFYSVYAEQMFRVYVHDCVFFGDNGGSGYIGIYLTTSTPFAKIHDNYIRGNAGSNGIVTTSASQIVHSNTFIGTATGYWMQSGTNNSIAYGNISFTSDAGVLGGTSVLNSGTGNQVFNNY